MALNVDKILDGLNEQQRKAVTFEYGPLLIVAGAGTGKTRVITHRIAYLIAAKLAQPEEILALTFTDKAAAEMEERVDLLLPYGYANVQISTFHAFGDRLLREYGLELGLPNDLRVLTQPEQYIFFREHLFEFPLKLLRPLSDPTHFIQAILNLISRAKDEDVSPDEYLTFAERALEQAQASGDQADILEAEKQIELAKTYALYQELLAREGKIDFGDQVALLLKLFRERPHVLRKVQNQFRFVLVDEFQDTNFAQYQLLKLLTGTRRNITVVGDDDQSIYKFRGAAISNILNFSDEYPDAQKIVLATNYRSSQAILDAAYRLIKYNNPHRLEEKLGINKRLTAHYDMEPHVYHLQYETLFDEADGVAQTIQRLKEEKGFRYSDFAILVRSNNDAAPYLQSLNMAGIPYRFSGNRGLYQQPEVKVLLSFLRVLNDPDDSISLFHLASSEMYMVSMDDLTRCNNFARKQNLSLFQVLEKLETLEIRERLSEETVATLQKLVRDIHEFLKRSRDRATGVVLYEFMDETRWLQKLAHSRQAQADLKVQNIARFFDVVRNFGYVAKVDRVQNFVPYLDMLIEAGDNPATAEADMEADAVQVLTVHKAKGLEFPVVFLVGLVQNRFPHNRRPEMLPLPDELVKENLSGSGVDSHLQEERRLFYVAMTRAKQQLYMSNAVDYGGVRSRKVSQFVVEALDKPLPPKTYIKTSPLQQIARNAPVENQEYDPFSPIPDSETLTLSFYQIDDYLTCPLKYKYVHVLRVPLLPHHTIVYGKALHDAVEEYLRRKVRSLPVCLNDLIAVFESSWSSEGFLTREHEEMRLEAGKDALKRFFETEEENPQIPLFIEKEFSFLLDNNRIVGRWDRIDRIGDGIEILDYKSSEVQEQDKADKRAKESLQLAIYALAYRENFGELPRRVKLYFLESGLIGSAELTEKMLEKQLKKIRQAAAGIRQRNYDPIPNYFTCSYCAYANICPSAQK